MRQNIELHIDELVLHGFDHVDRYRVGQAVECELARLLSEQGIGPSLAQGGQSQQMDGGTFNMAPDSTAETIGVQVAQSVYAGSAE